MERIFWVKNGDFSAVNAELRNPNAKVKFIQTTTEAVSGRDVMFGNMYTCVVVEYTENNA